MKIKEVWLFTNRNVAIFDATGEQISDLQACFGWKPLPSWEEHNVKEALEKIVAAKPVVYLAQWQNWRHEITMDEFCSLLGFGPWYWEQKKQKLAEQLPLEDRE